MKKHRNSQKRIYFEDAIYFVTTNTKNWIPFFKEKIFCDLFVKNLRICKKLKGLKLYAWFLGYDHFHLLLHPSDEFNYSEVMHNLKRTTSLQINQIIEGEDIYPRLQTDCVFQWHKSFHDHIIRNDLDFGRHWEYIKWNPTKHNMPDGWPYTFTNPKYEDLIDYIDY